MKNQKGFTLIELMVVVIIIGVLAAIAIPRFIGAQHKARVSAAKADVSIIRQGLGLYQIDYGDYPNVATYALLQAALKDPDGNTYVNLPKDSVTVYIDGTTDKYKRVSATDYKITAEVLGVPTGYAQKYVHASADSVWTKASQ